MGESLNRYSLRVYSYNRLGVIPNEMKSKRRSRESGYSEESPLVTLRFFGRADLRQRPRPHEGDVQSCRIDQDWVRGFGG